MLGFNIVDEKKEGLEFGEKQKIKIPFCYMKEDVNFCRINK